jgi:TRAP-type C4-dicarboxylate transport system permease large subunit
MIFLIAIGAKIFVSFVSLTRVSPSFLDWLQSTHAPLVIVMAAIVLLYIVLGMFLDSIGILVLTLPFTVPLVEGYHLDMVWFGVVVIKLLDIGLISRPIGLYVLVIKSVAPPRVSLEDVFKGACWFLLLDFVVLLLLLLFPSLSLLIPRAAF